MSGSWLSATTSVFFWAWATPASSVSATSAAVTTVSSGDVSRRMSKSSPIRVVGSLGRRIGAHDNSRSWAMGHRLGAGHRATVLGGDVELVKAGAAPLLDLACLGNEHGPGRGGREVVDGHAQRDRILAVRVAGGAEGDIGQRKDHTAVRVALEVEHV